jgi:hypothetical protein
MRINPRLAIGTIELGMESRIGNMSLLESREVVQKAVEKTIPEGHRQSFRPPGKHHATSNLQTQALTGPQCPEWSAVWAERNPMISCGEGRLDPSS